MREARIWRALMGLANTVVKGIAYDEDDEILVVHVRPTAVAGPGLGHARRS